MPDQLTSLVASAEALSGHFLASRGWRRVLVIGDPEAAALLARRGYAVAGLGSPSDLPMLAEVHELAGEAVQPDVHDLVLLATGDRAIGRLAARSLRRGGLLVGPPASRYGRRFAFLGTTRSGASLHRRRW